MVLPTYAIVGTQKGGTASLLRSVSRHPRVGRSHRKEVHFFDRHYRKGLAWYSEQFVMTEGQQHVGEATPLYMYDPVVRDRMIEALPELLVVVTLRDPVSRAYSHYWHSRRYGREDLSTFEAAVDAEPQRLATAGRRDRAAWAYLDRGRYLGQLMALEAAYGRERICVTTLEGMMSAPEKELTRVLTHLGVDPGEMATLVIPHANRYGLVPPKERRRSRGQGEQIEGEPTVKYPPISAATRELLGRQFEDEDERLRQWLGWEHLPWRVPAPGS